MSVDKSTALNIEMQADGGPVLAALTKVEAKQRELEEGQKRLARESRKTTDEAVQGYKRMEDQLGRTSTAMSGATPGGGGIMGGVGRAASALGLGNLGPAAAIAAVTMGIRRQMKENEEIAAEGIKRQRSLAQIAFGAGELPNAPDIGAALEEARRGLPIGREAGEAAYAGIRDVLPQTRFASTETASRLAGAAIRSFGLVQGDDPAALRKSAAFGAELFKFLQQGDPGLAGKAGVEDQVMSLAMRVQQDAGATNPEQMLRTLGMMGVKGGGLDLLSLGLAANQEAALRNQSPEMFQALLKRLEAASGKMETVAGPGGAKSQRLAYPELNRMVGAGDYTGALRYLLETPQLPPGLARDVAGEQAIGLEVLRANAAGIREQAEVFRETFLSGDYAKQQAALYGRMAPDVLSRRAYDETKERKWMEREPGVMRSEAAYNEVGRRALDLGMPSFAADMVVSAAKASQAAFDGLKWNPYWRFMLSGGDLVNGPMGRIEIRTQDGIDAQGVD